MTLAKIYQIASKDLQKVKAILEAPDVDPEMAKVLAEREKAEEGLAKVKKRKDHADFGQLQAAEDAVKALDKKIEELKAAGKMKVNEWARQGYVLRTATSMGFTGDHSYLYVKADEDFFKRNEAAILKAGAKALVGAEFEKVRAVFEKESEGAAEGMGFIFGGG